MIEVTIIGGLLVLLVVFLLKREPGVKAGVYRLPGRWYWLKRIAFFILFRLRSARKQRESSFHNFNEGSLTYSGKVLKGYGIGDGYDSMERPQILSDSEYAIDCAYFGATSRDGCNVVCRLARRNNQCAEIWLFLEVPGIGCLQHPRHPDTDVYYTDGKSFRAGGLVFEILEPMKRWKITYSGKLRKGLCNDVLNKPQDFVETKFSFTWSTFSSPFNFDTDMACSVLGDSVAREPWNRDFFQRLKDNHQSHYEQWGELRGKLQVEGHDEMMLYLQCIRDHSFGRRDWRSFHRYIIHFIYLESGMSIQVGVFSQPDLMSHVKIGYVSYGNGDIVSVSDVALNLWEVAEESREPPAFWTFSFQANGQTFIVRATRGTTPVWYHHEDRGGKVLEVFTDFEVNSVKGRGISEFFYRNPDGPSLTSPALCPLVVEPSEAALMGSHEKVVLSFTSPACMSPTLVGGKGAQLAQLTSLQNDIAATVPLGFCLTLKSFELQLKENKQIIEAIQAIADAAVSDLPNLHVACNSAVNMIITSDVCPIVEWAMLDSLKQCFGSESEKLQFAVRSSAAGEDGAEASSAGQMETVLGVMGSSQMLAAVKKCWASAYTVQAVEYRRQHGQPVNVLMGIVVQKMVPAQCAGVMFTVDPVTGSNSSLLINANYGLGESVVSGRADPDTICVERDLEFVHDTSALRVDSVRVGGKKMKVVGTVTGGVIEQEALSSDADSICLTHKMILKLATIGIELEKRFGSPRDIEWAVVGEDIYLLQCRPITVTESESEEELIHEFDSPMTCANHWLTTSNISEMMPGAVTPLTLSTFSSAIEYSLQMLSLHLGGKQRATHLPKCLLSNCNHLFISLLDISTIFLTTLMVQKDSMEINILGSRIPEFKVEHIERYYGRPGSGLVRRALNFISMLRMYSKARSLTHQWEKKLPNYTVGKEATSAVDLYKCIDKQLIDYETVWTWTLINSGRSGNMTTVLMSIIGGNPVDWTSDHYGDIALLLSKCEGIYSAEVPYAMENIAWEIVKSSPDLVENFLTTPEKDCLALLREYPVIEKLMKEFLDRHGHRCLREAELREKSWRSAPEKFISVLKIMLKTRSFEKVVRSNMSLSEMLANMKTRIPFHKRIILKKFLPRAQKEVAAREWGKSISIQMSDIFKQAYSRLGTLLHKEGKLPDSDLVYFLTHKEIGDLLASQSAWLIIKAQRRRKVLSKQMEQKFDRINASRPVPANADSRKNDLNVECLKGLPVSQGLVTGPAQVVHNLEGASVIKAGDILVVNSTDVGWSPYFPLIGGLITELGGLVSHGAVVAREYGIPCVVNVPNATNIIKSGEQLELDGRIGTVKRLNVAKKDN